MTGKRDTGHPAFEARTEVEELAGQLFIACEEWSVNEWHPLPGGEGSPTQVHIAITPAREFTAAIGFELRFLMRLKSREAADAMIRTLQYHRNNVWSDT